MTNGTVYRWLRIDGVTPFAEASEIGFSYDVGWQFLSFGGDGADGKSPEDYLVYLTAGRTPCPWRLRFRMWLRCLTAWRASWPSLGDLYLDIVMITSGTAPTATVTIRCTSRFPNFEERLRTNKEALDQLDSELGSDPADQR